MKKTITTKEEIAGNILLEKDEKLLTFKNKINGEILYSTSKYKTSNINGKDFLPVFRKPLYSQPRRVNLIALDAIEKIRS